MGSIDTPNGKASKTPDAKAYEAGDGLMIQPPLIRRGHGPALIVLIPEGVDTAFHEKTLDPPPLQKWAEEGWAVAQITIADDETSLRHRISDALAALRDIQPLGSCDSTEKTGLIGT